MNGLIGSQVKEPNIILRYCIIIFLGILGAGIALGWRSAILLTAEYQEMPISKQTREIKKKNEIRQMKVLNASKK